MDLKESQTKAESEKNKAEQEVSETNRDGGQLTFFYNGSVSVFDGVTPEKAQAIILIAAAASAVSGGKVGPAVTAAAAGPAAVASALMRSLSLQSSSVAAVGSTPMAANGSSLCKLQADLPIARRHSLQQFLEKRRNRLVSKAPYAPAKKSDEGMDVGLDVKPLPQLS